MHLLNLFHEASDNWPLFNETFDFLSVEDTKMITAGAAATDMEAAGIAGKEIACCTPLRF